LHWGLYYWGRGGRCCCSPDISSIIGTDVRDINSWIDHTLLCAIATAFVARATILRQVPRISTALLGPLDDRAAASSCISGWRRHRFIDVDVVAIAGFLLFLILILVVVFPIGVVAVVHIRTVIFAQCAPGHFLSVISLPTEHISLAVAVLVTVSVAHATFFCIRTVTINLGLLQLPPGRGGATNK
jgi:hypothetical protein